MFNSLKAIGSASLSAASAAAAASKALAVKTYNELNEAPTQVKCSNCPLQIPVPKELFQWSCGNEQCADNKNILENNVTACPSCMRARPAMEQPVVECKVCKAKTSVPLTNASKHLANAKEQATKAAIAAKAYSEKTYAELKSAPTEINCEHCTTLLQIDWTQYEWTCSDTKCGKVNQRFSSACVECKSAIPKMDPPMISCPTCNNQSKVPLSNAWKHIGKAADTTKKFAAATKVAAEQQYAYLKAAPVQFNCKFCNEALQTPGVAEGQQLPATVICGKCQKETPVPKSNMANVVTKTTNTIKGSSTKAYYSLSGKPTITCDVCAAVIALPQPAQGQYQQGDVLTVSCKTCGKTFTATPPPPKETKS